MEPLYTDIMVDLETTGTKPTFNGILQLAAVKFNFETQTVGPAFDRCPSLLPNRFWDDGTREFWGKNAPVYRSIIARQEPYLEVFQDFSKWVTEDAPPGGYRFWAKPAQFDWSFLESHYGQLGLPIPFHYRQQRDLNTFIAACRSRGAEHVNMDWVQNEHNGPAHDALSDCVLQLRMLFHAANGVFHEVIPADR